MTPTPMPSEPSNPPPSPNTSSPSLPETLDASQLDRLPAALRPPAIPERLGAPELDNTDVVVAFYDLDGFGRAMKENDWTIQRHVSKILEHADNPDARISLAALKEFRALRRDVLEEQGVRTTASQQSVRTLADGTQVRQKVTAQTTLLSRLTAAQPTKDIHEQHPSRTVRLPNDQGTGQGADQGPVAGGQ